MLDFLSSLVSYLVLLIFLAILLELIMPQKAFKKYVQMVFGLLLIMAIISPLTGLRGLDFDNGSHLFSIYSGEGSMVGLDEVLEWGQQLEEEKSDHTLTIYQDNVAQEIDKLLRERFAMKVESYEISFKDNGQAEDFGSISFISICARPASDNLVRPVEKVDINDSPSDEEDMQLTDDLQLLESEMESWVGAYLSLEEEKIKIKVLRN